MERKQYIHGAYFSYNVLLPTLLYLLIQLLILSNLLSSKVIGLSEYATSFR